MDFALTEQQDAIRAAIPGLRSGFDDASRTERDRQGGFPTEFHAALARDGRLGIHIPEAYGGSGPGITEAAITTGAIAGSGAGMSGASTVHMKIFGLNPVIVFGAEEQNSRAARS